jgi:hypothetical protein
MDKLKQAVECLMEFRHPEGYFSPYPQKAITKGRNLCVKFNLEESWQKPVARHIYFHTSKVIEVLERFAPQHKVIQQAKLGMEELPHSEPSYEEIVEELKTGMFTKLVVTGVDSTLFAMLRGYSRTRENGCDDNEDYLKTTRKKIIKSVQHLNLITDLSHLAWALYLWKRDEQHFGKALAELTAEMKTTSDLGSDSKEHRNFSMKSWEQLLDICINKLSGSSEKYVEEFPLPVFESKEFYGGKCHSTAYTYLNLKRILKLYENPNGAIYDKIYNATKGIFSWIKPNIDKYSKNPYLLALYIECLYEDTNYLEGMKANVSAALTKAQKPQRRKGESTFTINKVLLVLLDLAITIAVSVLLINKCGTGTSFLDKVEHANIVITIAGIIFGLSSALILGGWEALKKRFIRFINKP